MLKKGYVIFNDYYKMNIVGIRRIVPGVVNEFDDLICTFFFVPSKIPWLGNPPVEVFQDKISEKFIVFSQFPATTEPGKPFMLKPINPKGTAILVEGQYHSYKIDKHNGKYDALCQRLSTVEVWRDNNKDLNYDFKVKEKGMFGINIHRASKWAILRWIDSNSAGCQVIQSPKHFEDLFMSWAYVHRNMHGNSFTYTLINEKDLSDV